MGQVGAVPAQGPPGSSDASSKASSYSARQDDGAVQPPEDQITPPAVPPSPSQTPFHWGNRCLAFSSLFIWFLPGSGYFQHFSLPSYPGWHRQFVRICFPLEAVQAEN